MSDHKNVVQSGVISVGLSDHMLIYCTRKVTKVKTYSHNTVRVRNVVQSGVISVGLSDHMGGLWGPLGPIGAHCSMGVT